MPPYRTIPSNEEPSFLIFLQSLDAALQNPNP